MLLGRILLICTLLVGLAYSLILAYTAILLQRADEPSIVMAADLIPYNASALDKLSLLRPLQASDLRKQSLVLNSFAANNWIQLGLNAEWIGQDTKLAESYLLKATQINHMWAPKWALADFYFRRKDVRRFIEWARSALLITPSSYSRAPMFVRLWILLNDSKQIADIIPNDAVTLFQYLDFLVKYGQMDSIESIANRAIEVCRLEKKSFSQLHPLADILGSTINALLYEGRVGTALRIWSKMSFNHWIQVNPPSVIRPITNGRFTIPTSGYGFDWRLLSVSGITIDEWPDLGELRVDLSGTQPEQCRLLSQFIPINPLSWYNFSWNYESNGPTRQQGFSWKVYFIGQNGQPDAFDVFVSPDLTLGEHGQGKWRFRTPADFKLAIVTLEYARPIGRRRAEGTFSLTNVAMQQQ